MNEEPINPEEPLESAKQTEYLKSRRPYTKLAVELEPADLSSEGVQKMILAEIERLETRVSELQVFEGDFHKIDKKCVRFEERLKKNAMLEILYTIAIAIGAGLLGWLPASKTQTGTVTIILMSVALFTFALFAKWKGDKNES